MSANPTDTHNETTGFDTYDNHVLNWAPQAMLWYDIDDNTNVRGFYFGRSQQPSVSQLMRVPDNTNPLSVSFGNMYLEPYFNHSFRSDFRHTNKKNFLSVNAGLDGGIVKNPIVNAQWYGTNGAQYSIPVNGKDSYNGSFRIMLNSPIAKSNFSVFLMSRASYSKSSSYVGSSSFDMGKYYEGDNYDAENFLADKFLEDFHSLDFTLNNLQTVGLMERLRLTYRNDVVELTAGGRTRMSKSWYTIANQSTNMTWSNQVSASMNWTVPGGLGIVADGNYNWYNGYTTDQGTQLIPADFIAFVNTPNPTKDGDQDVHELFLGNYFAQTKALAFGKTADEVRAEGTPEEIVPARVFTGNRPTTSIFGVALTPFALGELIALYEHITFVEGTVWGLDSYDQWGVELGKQLAKQITPAISQDDEALAAQDASTQSLIQFYRANRKF